MASLDEITDRIVSGSATFIAIVALATAVYQAKLSRDQAKAAVWPYLIQGNSGNDGYSRIVQNVGLGPAVIRAFEVRIDGHPVQSWKEAADSLHITLSWRGHKSTTFRSGIVLPTASTVELLELPDSSDIRTIRQAIRGHLETWVCFCSLYGDCWTQIADDYEPKPAKACVDDPKRRFLE